MKLKTICSGAILAVAVATQAIAEYPEKTIEMILPWPALATSTDIIARKVAEQMDPILGQTVKAVNKPEGQQWWAPTNWLGQDPTATQSAA